jgi:hypothetical protein
MPSIYRAVTSIANYTRLRAPVVCAALISFMAGSLGTERLLHIREVRADNNRVFQLMIYHTLPGKADSLEAIFQDVSVQMTKHNLNVIGYWRPIEDPAWKDNTFVYVVAHASREKAEANWRALHTDPLFLPYRKAAAPLISVVNARYDVDEIYMRPSEFSPIK